MAINSILVAATEGSVEFLLKAYGDNVEDLQSYFLGREETSCENLLHLAVDHNQYTFLYEALTMLSSEPTLVIDLICQPITESGCNPIHTAASGGNIFILKLLVKAYNRAITAAGINQETPPWLRKDLYNNTPLRRSFFTERRSSEVLAMYLVSLDQNLLKTMGEGRYPMDKCSTLALDHQQSSIVFNAMVAGCSLLVEQILTSGLPYSVKGNRLRETPLHYASRCSEKVSRLLLERNPELIEKVCVEHMTMLDKAVEGGATWLIKLMLVEEEGLKYTNGYKAPPWIKACRTLIWPSSANGDTPLHIAAWKGNIDIAKLLIEVYNYSIEDEGAELDGEEAQPWKDHLGVNPLYIKNSGGHMPLVVALGHRHDDCGVILAKETFPLTANHVTSGIHWEALLAANDSNCRQSVKTILAIIVNPDSVKAGVEFNGHVVLAPGVLKIFSYLFIKYQEMSKMEKSEEMEKLSEVLSEFLKRKNAKTLLKEAAGRNENWLVELFLESDASLLMESAPAWQAACEKGYDRTLFTIVDKFGDQEFIRHCQHIQQTPFHHIKLDQFERFMTFIETIRLEELHNQMDNDGATPLHRAIQRDDLELTKALLQTEGLDVTIKDKNGTTAFDLLENCSSTYYPKNWHEEYIKMLEMPMVEGLINQIDQDGDTPLHRAIQREHLQLARVLLENKGIELSIKNKNGKTAFDLLENRCVSSTIWGKMCREIEQDSTVEKLKYLFRKISFVGMQSTSISSGGTSGHYHICRRDHHSRWCQQQ